MNIVEAFKKSSAVKRSNWNHTLTKGDFYEYLYLNIDGVKVPYVPTGEDIEADDWEIVE